MGIVAGSAYAAMLMVVAFSDVTLDLELYQRMLPVMLSVVAVVNRSQRWYVGSASTGR